MTKFLNISTDNTLGGNSPSDVTVSSQKAIKEYVDNNSGSEVDNSTINENSSDQLQAIGLINKNTASGATNPKYDWVGTLQQYNDQAVATNHPEWICYITDDVTGGTSVYTKSEVNGLLDDKADDSDVVKLTGNQTIAGTKTFTSAPNIKMTQPNLYMQYSVISKGTAPSMTTDGWFGTVYDKNGTAQANKMAQIYHDYNSNGVSTLNLAVFEPTSGSTNNAKLTIGYDQNKNVFTVAPTPATSDNSTKIATTAFVKAQGYAAISSIFPVGSCYVTIGNTNPNTILGVGTWALVTSSVITSVNTNVPCKGNGKALGLTNGTDSYPLANYAGGNWALGLDNTTDYSLSTATPSFATINGRFGVNTDATKSGIVGTVTRTSTTLYIWQRTA